MADHVERFAPSPTGPLHLGHAFSAITAWDRAQATAGRFLLRIEDIDQERSRLEWETLILQDLTWLGLSWPEPVLRQSERLETYREALQLLWSRELLYKCNCSRGDIRRHLTAPQEGSENYGPDGLIYPGTCRSRFRRGGLITHTAVALRLDMQEATKDLTELRFTETGIGPNGETGEIVFNPKDLIAGAGDILLARYKMATSYHLSVVLDDAFQDVSHVTRGHDIFEATKLHVLLQHLLGLPTPIYHHHRLIRDENGKRLAKRDDARAIRKYREEGATPEDIRKMVGL